MDEENDFDWEDEEVVVVKPALAIAVYENERGEIVVRQEDRFGEQDAIVVFPKAYAQAIIDAIQALIQPEDP